jgi:hypothetical protein
MLKKMVTLIAATLFAGTLLAGNAFAEGTLNGLDVPGFASSKSVDYAYEGAGTPVDRYAISTKHVNGNNYYGTYSGSARIFVSTQNDKVGVALTGANNPTVPATITDSGVTGGIGSWSDM